MHIDKRDDRVIEITSRLRFKEKSRHHHKTNVSLCINFKTRFKLPSPQMETILMLVITSVC